MADSTAFLSEFWEEKYLRQYIPGGGSKIKFVTGRPGSGKTWFLDHFAGAAEKDRYITISFSANDIWLNDFREFFLEILRHCSMEKILSGCADQIIREMGYDPDAVPEGQTFMDMLSEQGAGDPMTRREIRDQLRRMFLANPLMDNNFALACSLLTGGILGYPVLESADRNLVLSWLSGDRTLKLSLIRTLGLTDKITRYNSRHMLRSLAETVHAAGFPGMLITVDDLEILQDKRGNETIRYTKLRREDTYESIRQMIDDIDSMRYIMFVYGFDRALIDNENAGLKSYQALWMRIQNEIVSERFNRFVDIADMDRLAIQVMEPEDVVNMARDMIRNLTEQGKLLNGSLLSAETSGQEGDASGGSFNITRAEEILNKARVSGIGLQALLLEEVCHD